MRLLARAFVAVAVSIFSVASISSASTLGLSGEVGSRIGARSAGIVTYNGSFGAVTFAAKPSGSDQTSIDIGLLNTTGSCYLRIDETGSILGSGFDMGSDSDDAINSTSADRVNRWVAFLHFMPDQGEWNDFKLARIRARDSEPEPGNPIPEPSSLVLMLIGGGIVASQVLRRA
jgi:hypothetical protein